jgi:threonine/homoserine/homoserine lactone efflux protein
MIDQLLMISGITFLVMLSPGPDMVIVLRNTFLHGRRAGLETSLGVLAGNLVPISYCVLGIGWLISQSILAFTILKYAGAAYLIWLGILSFRSGSMTLDPDMSAGRRRHTGWFLQGFFSNVLNPKGTLFYLGVFTLVITPDTSTNTMLILVFSMLLISAAFWLFFVYTLERPLIRGILERSQQTVNRLFGVLLVFLGLRVALMER